MEPLAHPEALGWVALLLALGMMPAPPMAGPGLDVAFAVQVAVAMLYDPAAAGAIAALGAVDLRGLRRRPAAALSRCVLALVGVAAGSATFHLLAGPGEPAARLLGAFLACAVLMWLVEVAATAAASPARWLPPRRLLVRELVGVLGGTIEVETRPGAGSRFTVVLPVRHPGAPQRVAAP